MKKQRTHPTPSPGQALSNFMLPSWTPSDVTWLNKETLCAPVSPSGCHVLHLAHGDTLCSTLSIQLPCTAPYPSRIHQLQCSTIHPRHHAPHLVHPSATCSLLHQDIQRYQSEALQVSLCLRHVGWGGPQPAHQAQAHPCVRAQPSSGTLENQSPNPWPQMAASHLHQCSRLKPGGSE